MNTIDLVETGRHFLDRVEKPTPLFQDDSHAVYWIGIPEDSAFRCNTYLVVDGTEAVLIDPGGRKHFELVKKRVEQVVPLSQLGSLILCHQDPDVAGSICDWLDLKPELQIISSIRTNILLPHYGKDDYSFYNINESPEFFFLSGRKLVFIESPFMHFPGAFVTHDVASNFLFSGDIWASVDMDWRLVVEDFRKHELKLSLFHIDYMASNLACRGFLKKLGNITPDAILPQHGSVIPGQFVMQAFEYLRNLKCGLDLIYSGLK